MSIPSFMVSSYLPVVACVGRGGEHTSSFCSLWKMSKLRLLRSASLSSQELLVGLWPIGTAYSIQQVLG